MTVKSEMEVRRVSNFPETIIHGRYLNQAEFYFTAFVLYHFSAGPFCRFTAYKYPRNDISSVTYRRSDSCRNHQF